MNKLALYVCLCGTWMVSSCGEKPEALSVIPQISVENIAPTQVSNFENAVVITLTYTDGDGDLGAENPDQAVLFVQDSRLNTPDTYHIQPLAPVGSEVPIQGTLQIKLNPFFILGNGTTETVQLQLTVKDRAGNTSEPVSTPNIVITR